MGIASDKIDLDLVDLGSILRIISNSSLDTLKGMDDCSVIHVEMSGYNREACLEESAG